MAARKKTPTRRAAARRSQPRPVTPRSGSIVEAAMAETTKAPVTIKLTPAQEIEQLKSAVQYVREARDRAERIVGEQRATIKSMALVIGRGNRY